MANLNYLKSRYTNGQPHNSYGVSGHDIAEVVHTQVQSTDSDCEDQHRGGNHKPHSLSGANHPRRPDHVRKHAIPDERSQRVPAWEAERHPVKESCCVNRSGPLNDVLEDDGKHSSAAERPHPRSEDKPLT